ncbi:MAG: hypothetical protein GY856_32350 [bacterium]|nr:hypothetical protein [bacterium]
MQRLALFLLLLGWPGAVWADVTLPESGHLAGPLDSLRSELGDEFFNFPEFMGQPPPPPGGALLSGWVEIEFGEPDGDTVGFTVTYHGVGTPDAVQFVGGQQYEMRYNEAFPQPPPQVPNSGTLDLVSGEVTDVNFPVAFRNSTIADLSKLNRVGYAAPPLFPPPELPPIPGLPSLDEFPPGFITTDLSFAFDADGRITGLQFIGLSILPGAVFAAYNDVLNLFPPYCFGPRSEFYFSNPVACLPDTPPENCPNNSGNPDGIAVPLDSFFHPHFYLASNELREVPAERLVPPCEPMALAPGRTVVAAGGKLYHIGGLDGHRLTGEVSIYDPETNVWSAGPPLPLPVSEAQGAAVGTKIYLVGGRRSLRGPATGWLQELDTETGVWSQLSSAPFPAAQGAAAVADGRLYVLGGRTNRPNGSPAGNLRFTGVVQGYDPPTDTWSAVNARFAGAWVFVTGNAAVTVGTDIYLVNGHKFGDVVTNEVWIFDTIEQQLEAGPPTLWGVYDAVAAQLDGRIYLAGGRSAIDGPADPRAQILELGRNDWVPGEPEPFPTTASGSAVLDGQLYVVGGRSMAARDEFPGPLTGATQTFDPARGWQLCRSQPLFNADAVLNSASLTVGPAALSPGSLATLNGYNLALGTAVASPAEPQAPEELGGVSITVDGLPAPILSVHPMRVDFQIPYGVTTGDQVELTLANADLPLQAPPVVLPMADVSPGIFIQNCGETRTFDYLHEAAAIACNGDGTFNYGANAVRAGATVSLQMTGLGPVTPPLANGLRAPLEEPIFAEYDPIVTVRGTDGEMQEAAVVSATLVPGTVGLFNVVVEVPADSLEANRVAVEATVEGLASNRAVLSVGEPTTSEPLACMLYFEPLVSLCLPLPPA